MLSLPLVLLLSAFVTCPWGGLTGAVAGKGLLWAGDDRPNRGKQDEGQLLVEIFASNHEDLSNQSGRYILKPNVPK